MAEATSIDPRIVAGSDYGVSDREWTRIDWRGHLRRVELPGASVNYVEIGEGEPLLFIHGVSGCWQNWLENLPHFAAAGRRCVALDLPGFGGSPMPEWPITMEGYGRLVRDFCEKLGLGGATLVGNSMGGLVATELALAAPDAFERLVLVSAAGIINTWRPEERAVVTAWWWRRFSPLFAGRGRQIVARPRLRRAVFQPFVRFPNRLDDDILVEQIVNGLREADGLRARPRRPDPHRPPRAAGDDRDADADRLGPLRPRRPGRRGDLLPPPHPPLPPGDLRAHRPRPPTGAPAQVQRAAGGLPRWMS